MRCFLIVVFACWLAVPGRLIAQTVDDYEQCAIEAAGKHEYDKAIADYNQILLIDPKNVDAYIGRGGAWADKGDYDKAIFDLTRALTIDPKNSTASYNRAVFWEKKRDYGKAIADYTKTIGINPKESGASQNLASIYASCADAKFRDGKKAVQYARKACQLRGDKYWDPLVTLAAAYAENGDFTKARESQEKAIGMAPKECEESLRTRLELYKQGKPYHEPPVKK